MVLGAGARGRAYADYVARHPDEGEIVAVADHNPVRRQWFADTFDLPADRVFVSWEEALAQPRLADLVTVTTQDAYHVAPAVAAARLGYHILLEKPMAPTEEECREVVAAVEEAGVLLAVCHVLRYTPHTLALQKLIAEGAIGDIVSIEHLEPVGFWHFAHSFVRGSWRNEAESSPVLLAKSCHDIDWLLAIAGRPCTRVSSFGSLMHFRPENQPQDAGERCVTCPSHVESRCPYSAKKLYLGALALGQTGWPVNVITDDVTEAGVEKALQEGPYGRCAYLCDNDVLDHQVVNLEFEGGLTASFTMSAFTTMRGRMTKIFGTMGEISTNSEIITVDDFRTFDHYTIDTRSGGQSAADGHGGGDDGLMRAVLGALRTGDPSLIPSDAQQSLQSHLMVFAAERARTSGTVEPVPTR